MNIQLGQSAKQFQAICRLRRSAGTKYSSKYGHRGFSRNSSDEAKPPGGSDLENVAKKPKNGRRKDHQLQKDFFLSVLSATTTRRDAKSYLSSFQPTQKPSSQPASTPDVGVERLLDWPLHVALIKLRSPETLPDDILQGLASTLSLLSRLGLSPIIVLDCERTGVFVEQQRPGAMRQLLVSQTHRVITALQREPSLNASRLDSVLGVTQISEESRPSALVRGSVHVQYSEMLRGPLTKGTIPVIPPIGYTTESQRIIDVEADQVMLALTRDFAGLNAVGKHVQDPEFMPKTDNITLDRIIILDPLGGLPSVERPDKSHIFVNMEQEYWEIKQELMGTPHNESTPAEEAQLAAYSNQHASAVDHYSQASQGLDSKLSNSTPSMISGEQLRDDQSFIRARQVANLDLLQRTLALLPTTSSALLTTPTEAATLSRPAEDSLTPSLGVRTRSPRNPLIYNLLTNKPHISSSLPVARVDSSPANYHVQPPPVARATFCKRGMPLTIIPDPRVEVWSPPHPSADPSSPPALTLHDDPRIDFSRLVNLIEDSFGRPLDVPHYLARVKHRLAGLIVAGSYEGGAILTWELPPSVSASDLTSPDPAVAEAARRRMVPYLDKFAVLKRSQGSAGVADILFTAMVRSCFPGGVCWRSRRENPVNKWYFERSVGSFKIPGDKWTMFWTTEGLPELDGGRRFEDYMGVCQGVEASWADGGGGME